MNPLLLTLILHASAYYQIEPAMVMAVMEAESNFNVNAVGSKGEIGLMQLMPKSFPNYRRKDLFNPELNIVLGIRHLARVKRECKHKEYIVCYNLGSPKGNKIKYPTLFSYYKKVYPKYQKYRGLKLFKPGQQVFVLNARVDGSAEEGIIKGQCKERPWVGWWWVDFGFTTMTAEPSRILTQEQYRKQFQKQIDNESSRCLASSTPKEHWDGYRR